jgi:hypothetical protein
VKNPIVKLQEDITIIREHNSDIKGESLVRELISKYNWRLTDFMNIFMDGKDFANYFNL